MPASTITKAASALTIALLLLAGCADDDSDDATPPTDPTTTVPEEADAQETDGDTPDADTTTTTTPDGDAAEDGASTPITADDPRLEDGVWQVGDAGTVEFAIGDGGLELIEVLANDGWQVDIDEASPDEIEVDFRSGNREYEIEIEFENGILEVEIDLDIDPADPGSFDLGPAGTAVLSVDGSSVLLDDLTVADGWTVTDQDTSDGEVEIELRRDNVSWELEAEIDDGRLEVEIDFEIEGAFP